MAVLPSDVVLNQLIAKESMAIGRSRGAANAAAMATRRQDDFRASFAMASCQPTKESFTHTNAPIWAWDLGSIRYSVPLPVGLNTLSGSTNSEPYQPGAETRKNL